MIVAMLLDETRPASPIEVYLARCLGFCLLTMAVLTVTQTGLIPLTAKVMEPATADDTDPKAPYAVPTLMVTSMFHAVSASYAYIWYVASGQGTFVVGIAGYFVLAAMGLWCMLFASSNGKISRRNGAVAPFRLIHPEYGPAEIMVNKSDGQQQSGTSAAIKSRQSVDINSWIDSFSTEHRGKRLIVSYDKVDAVGGICQKLCHHHDAAAELEAGISDVAMRINSLYATLDHQPLVFLKQVLAFPQYLGLLTAADALMITSLREGMNVTSHEFIHCQDGLYGDKRYGSLILSEFTGSATLFSNHALFGQPMGHSSVRERVICGIDTGLEGTKRGIGSSSTNCVFIATPQRTVATLTDLTDDAANDVYVLSSRMPAELARHFRHVMGMGLIAENGCLLHGVSHTLAYFRERMEGSWVGTRHYWLVIHYGLVADKGMAKRLAAECADQVNDTCNSQGIHAVILDSVIVVLISTKQASAAEQVWRYAESSNNAKFDFLLTTGANRELEYLSRWAKELENTGFVDYAMTVYRPTECVGQDHIDIRGDRGFKSLAAAGSH
ncbi:hypothetical protein N7497_012295 [Penicillium chrysogenum]|nr:hypothetical protein N7497_012295 [Penicillium chrysogenum]